MKRLADNILGPKYRDGNYKLGFKTRKLRGWVGIAAAIVAYLIWNRGSDVGMVLSEAVAPGPIVGFLKLGLCTVAGMLVTLVVARSGHRLRVLRSADFDRVVDLGNDGPQPLRIGFAQRRIMGCVRRQPVALSL